MSEDRRVKKTKKLIKDTLIELLHDNPINKITVTELTDKADISRKTFYLHYSSIYDAKNDIENDIIEILNSIISTMPESTNETDIMSFFSQINEKTKNQEKLVAYFVQNAKQASLYNKVKDALKAAIINRLENVNKKNVYNEYIVEYVVSGILNTYIELSEKNDMKMEELSVLLTKLCTGASELLISN